MDVAPQPPASGFMTAAEFLVWPDDEFGRRTLVDLHAGTSLAPTPP